MTEVIGFMIENWAPILVALLLSFLPGVRKVSSYYCTLVHELGHGMLSLNPLGGLGGIKIRPDTSGENSVSYNGSIFIYGPIRIISLMSGYAAPIYAGLAMVVMTAHDLIQPLGWIIAVVSFLSLFAIRNLFGGLIILSHAAFWFLVFMVLPNLIPSEFVLITVGFILLARGTRDLIEVTRYVFMPRYSDMSTDFHILRDEFFFPRHVWFVLFLAVHVTVLTVLISWVFTL